MGRSWAVISINASREHGHAEPQRKAVETDSIVLSVFVGGVLVYQTDDPMLALWFSALLGFLLTNRLIRVLRG
jgi:uncharacterized membrane protein YfcA